MLKACGGQGFDPNAHMGRLRTANNSSPRAPWALHSCAHTHTQTLATCEKKKEIKVPVRVVTSGSYSLDRHDDGVQLLSHSGAQIVVVADF